jgi:hypothetical protein
MRHKKHKSQRHEPDVHLFGEEINETTSWEKEHQHWNCHHSGSKIIWGVVFLLLGGMLLLNNFGVVPWMIWDTIKKFWPMLLVLIGIKIILGNNIVSRIIILLLTIAVIGLIFLSGLRQIGSPLSSNYPQEINHILDTFDHTQQQ